ncbi:MAG: cation:proton antiporter domain-containing protein [Candidatus Cyclobacteriaceae bacterium M2_1C_046]
MEQFSAYTFIIAFSVIVIVSYFFNLISFKTNIPSVLLLIFLGIGITFGLEYFSIQTDPLLFDLLRILGIVGLIMIVLEAALDLKITKEKKELIWKSFSAAIFALIACALIIGYIFHTFIFDSFFLSLVYAVPLSIMSSAIIIPSVGGLANKWKEFMVYEGTFSDILGIMFFYFLIGNAGQDSVKMVVWDVLLNIFLTISLSVVLSYLLVIVFQKVTTHVKLFLLIAVLLLLYSIGKLFHLSSLVIILIFGIILNNHKIFFINKLKGWINDEKIVAIRENFHLITIETAFVIRTFFFVIFGMTLTLNTLLDLRVALISILILLTIYALRFLFLKILYSKTDISSILFIAPRGLITILLYFSIPATLATDQFNAGIFLYVILLTSIIMAISLIAKGKHLEPVDSLKMAYWEEIDKEIETIPYLDKHLTPEEKDDIEENTDKTSEPERQGNT